MNELVDVLFRPLLVGAAIVAPLFLLAAFAPFILNTLALVAVITICSWILGSAILIAFRDD
jgi:hypothetical protein